MSDNPFDAPVAAPRPRQGVRPGCRALLAFAIRRMLLLGVLPALVGALAASVGGSFVWVTAAAAAALLPSSVILLWTQFLAPVADERPVVLTSGTVRGRSAFVWGLRADAFERVVVGAAFFLLVGLFATASWWFVLMVPFAGLLSLWLAVTAVQSVVIGRAQAALAGDDLEGAVTTLGPLLRHPRFSFLVIGYVRVTAANALVRLGRVDEALKQLRATRGAPARQAELTAAGLLAARGDVDEARRLIGTRKPRSLGEQLAWETAHVLLAFEEGRPHDVLERAKGWTYLRTRMGSQIAAALDLYEAAAHALAGDPDTARSLAHPSVLAERAWMADAYPKLWAAIRDLG